LRRCRIHSAHRLPAGFIGAVNDAFTRTQRISDRVRELRLVLAAYGQDDSVLPTKIRRFLARFDDGGAR
jgi:hypothetical protein